MFCSLPAPTKLSRARWHFVEQVPCVLWARPERTFSTRALRRHAALPHAMRPDPGSLCIAEPRTSRPLLHDGSGTLLRRWPRPWRHAGVGSGLCHVRHRPNHASAPAAPGNSSCLSSCSSERFRRRHDALPLQESGRRQPYPRPPQEPASSAIKRVPELVQGFSRHQTYPIELPTP